MTYITPHAVTGGFSLDLTSPLIAAVAGLVLGGVIGAIAQVTTFCSVGAVADIVLAKDWRRMRSWLMAAAAALGATQLLRATGAIDVGGTAYSLAPAQWPVVALGSVAFGFGMAQAGGCVQRALVRMGSGSLKALVTLVIVAATSAATWRVMPDPAVSAVGLPPMLALTLTGVMVAALVLFCIKDPWFRASPGHLWGGAAIGLAVAAAWAFADTNRGFNLLLDLGLSAAAMAGAAPLPVFGVAGLAGMALGATAAAAARGDLYIDRFVDAGDIKRHVVGAVLMGIGGTIAVGCSFGQGLAGFSTLSIGALIAMGGMAAGCLWGIRSLEAGSAWGGLRLVFARG
jgi:uncharacterized membrane protein YedE/YeeE